MFCPNCGKKNPDGAKFCVACGQKLAVAMPSAEKPKPDVSRATTQRSMTSNSQSSNSANRPIAKDNLTNRYVIYAIAAVLVILVIIVVIKVSGGGNYSIVGTWKNNGSKGYGQAQPGATVVFDESNCNFFSPMDTYSFYKENGKYQLSITGLLGGSTTFDVDFDGKDTVNIYTGAGTVVLDRVG